VGSLYFQTQPDGAVNVFNLGDGKIELIVRRDDSVYGSQAAVERLNRMNHVNKPLPQYVRECASKFSGWEL
jgi:hypothetical protein